MEMWDQELEDIDDSKPKWLFAREEKDKQRKLNIKECSTTKSAKGEEFPVILLYDGPDLFQISVWGQNTLKKQLKEKFGHYTEWKNKEIVLTSDGKKWGLVE